MANTYNVNINMGPEVANRLETFGQAVTAARMAAHEAINDPITGEDYREENLAMGITIWRKDPNGDRKVAATASAAEWLTVE